MSARRAPAEHPAWHRLTADQRKAVNEVWEDVVVAALEEADRLKREAEEIRLEAQTIGYAALIDERKAIDAAARAVNEITGGAIPFGRQRRSGNRIRVSAAAVAEAALVAAGTVRNRGAT